MTMSEIEARPRTVVFTTRSVKIRKGDVLTEEVAHADHPVREFVVTGVDRDVIFYAPEHAYVPVCILVGRDLRNGQTVKHAVSPRRRWLVSRPVAEAMV